MLQAFRNLLTWTDHLCHLALFCSSPGNTSQYRKDWKEGIIRGNFFFVLRSFALILPWAWHHGTEISQSPSRRGRNYFHGHLSFLIPLILMCLCWQARAVRTTCHCRRKKNTYLTTGSSSRIFCAWCLRSNPCLWHSVISKGLMKFFKRESQTVNLNTSSFWMCYLTYLRERCECHIIMQ